MGGTQLLWGGHRAHGGPPSAPSTPTRENPSTPPVEIGLSDPTAYLLYKLRVATNLENMENLENSGNLKNCQNLRENSGKFELL